jgi:hypothetical protein
MSDGRTFARRLAIGAGALAISTSLLAASPALAASKPKPKATTTTTTKPKPKAPGIGSTLVVLNQDKQYEAVQLQAVTDPAQSGDGFSTPDAGKRYVGVTISIHNRSKGTDTGDANNNLTLVGSNNYVGWLHQLRERPVHVNEWYYGSGLRGLPGANRNQGSQGPVQPEQWVLDQ